MENPAIEKILKKVGKNIKGKELIEKAFEFAQKAHNGQKRFSGEDYIVHPLGAAQILSEMNLDPTTIAAALLHDVIDDTDTELETLEEKFGKEIAFLVAGVSKLGKLRYSKEPLNIKPLDEKTGTLTNLQAENLRKMFFAMAEDIRVVLIKLADRLHNMETLNYLSEEKKKRFALETLEIFAPLADRLGIGEMKGRLEDLAFPYLYPKEYEWLTGVVDKRFEDRKEYLKKLVPQLKKTLEKGKIKIFDIHSRPKHYFSLYQKLLKHDMDMGKIYDLVAVRVIVEDVKTCYQTLGAIHEYYQPLPGRIKDYIAIPKPNGYQSIHTTIFGEAGEIVEIQIRTREMHEEAEYGICAHWAAKEGVNLGSHQKKFAWIRELKDWQKEILTSKEFLDALKIDFFKNRIFVFTPRGDVIDLPEGACPIDFAYAVHTEIGNHCAGAKVNQKMVPVSAKLRNGNIVEILLDKNKTPSRDWLKFVKTGMARAHIRKQAKSILENLRERISPKEIVRKLFSKGGDLEKNRPHARSASITVAGETGIYFSLAKCCNPKPGDKIQAYITKDKGASIHKEDCESLKKSRTCRPEKIIFANWEEN